MNRREAIPREGIPYSVEELRIAADQPRDIYHRELMKWAAERIREQEQEIAQLRRTLIVWRDAELP